MTLEQVREAIEKLPDGDTKKRLLETIAKLEQRAQNQ